jgi:hypothetical protein
MTAWLNREVAARLDEVARLLRDQGANRYRVDAYRRGADAIRRLPRRVSDILRDEGLDGLERLPAIGPSLARAIRTLVESGRLPVLERLRGETDPVALLASVPGIGPLLARRLHQDLSIDTLEELEAAAHDGRLAAIAGMGEKRVAGVRDSLASRLGRLRPTGGEAGMDQPTVAELLDVDHEYRTEAAAGRLRMIAPRRFNPRREAWLPVLHTQRGDHQYTALFSNTARAHEWYRTHDWVVLYVDGARGERQYTAVTARRGVFKGRRVVRGREVECLAYYRQRGLKVAVQEAEPEFTEA